MLHITPGLAKGVLNLSLPGLAGFSAGIRPNMNTFTAFQGQQGESSVDHATVRVDGYGYECVHPRTLAIPGFPEPW